MKIFLMVSILISFSAFAQDCFIRNEEIGTREVNLAREICVTSIQVKLDLFGNSSAVIFYTLDGVDSKKEVNLSKDVVIRADGKASLNVPNMDQNMKSSGACSYVVRASSDAVLTLNKDGSGAAIESVSGVITKTNDWCHSPERTLQSLTYSQK